MSAGHSHEDLLWTIAGKAGENLATAYLGWLLGQQEIGVRLLKRVSECTEFLDKQARISDESLEQVPKVHLEVPTSNDDVAGRIDMILETDRWVIGVESKFHAGFQPGQPDKYVKTIQERAAPDRKAMLILLVPLARKDEMRESPLVRGLLQYAPIKFGVLAWEDLLKPDMQKDQWEFAVLSGYVAQCCDPFTQFARAKRELESQSNSAAPRDAEKNRQLAAIGDRDVQAQFLQALRTLSDDRFCLNGRLVSHAEHYTVYQFDLANDDCPDKTMALFGFVDRGEYGLKYPESQFDRVFVMCRQSCASGRASSERRPDELGLLRIEELDGARHLGIIRHAEKDGEVWVLPDNEWATGPTKENKERWVERLRSVFG